MKIKIFTFVITVFIFYPGSLYAQSSVEFSNGSMFEGKNIIPCPQINYSESFKQCVDSDKARGSFGECYYEELKLWDKKLNVQYQKWLSTYPDYKELKDSQRLWIKFRDANCEFLKDEPTGIPAVSKVQCLLEMTVLRSNELDRMLPQ